ncbi:MAG: AlpA family phage regulatory protein [Mesorhizobium sp.]|nr:MAG: AlpA family phage regulatory protein [Mesorhizobium sp.]
MLLVPTVNETASTGQHSILSPDIPLFLDWKDLKPIVRFSRATLHREVNANRFPKPITTAAQKTAWLKPDIEKWIAGRIAARDAETMA